MPDSRSAHSIDITDLRPHDQHQHHNIPTDPEFNNPTDGPPPPPPPPLSITSPHSTEAMKITAYRLTVTATIISFSLAKYLLTGKGKSLQANVLDLVIGVPLALLLFWLGFWEDSTSKCAWFFVDDFSDQIITGTVRFTILCTVYYALPLALSIACIYLTKSLISDDLRQVHISKSITPALVPLVVFPTFNLPNSPIRRWWLSTRYGWRWDVSLLLAIILLLSLFDLTISLLICRSIIINIHSECDFKFSRQAWVIWSLYGFMCGIFGLFLRQGA